MKKFSIVLLLVSVLLIEIVCAEGYNLLDMYQKPGDEGKIIPQIGYRPLHGKHPLVGASDATAYYLDTASCTAYQDGERYIIACIVYSADGGSPPIARQSTYKFGVCKFEDSFVVELESINDTLEKAQQMLQYDNGYLRFLFLQAAKCSNYPAAKVQALNREAEAQLKTDADMREVEYQRRQEEERVKTQSEQYTHQSYDGVYVGNVNSRIFHRASCPSVSKMKISNKVSIGSREEAVKRGYTPCHRCRP